MHFARQERQDVGADDLADSNKTLLAEALVSPGFTERALAADLLAGSMRHERQGTGHHNLRTLPRSYLAGYRATH